MADNTKDFFPRTRQNDVTWLKNASFLYCIHLRWWKRKCPIHGRLCEPRDWPLRATFRNGSPPGGGAPWCHLCTRASRQLRTDDNGARKFGCQSYRRPGEAALAARYELKRGRRHIVILSDGAVVDVHEEKNQQCAQESHLLRDCSQEGYTRSKCPRKGGGESSTRPKFDKPRNYGGVSQKGLFTALGAGADIHRRVGIDFGASTHMTGRLDWMTTYAAGQVWGNIRE